MCNGHPGKVGRAAWEREFLPVLVSYHYERNNL